MAYDEAIARRVRELIGGRPDVDERAMFGGLGFLVDGNLAVAASSRGRLMVRVDPAEAEQLTRSPEVDFVEMRGRTMRGWLLVGGAEIEAAEGLRAWVGRGVRFAEGLPAKHG